jgi:hypothetical protein
VGQGKRSGNLAWTGSGKENFILTFALLLRNWASLIKRFVSRLRGGDALK